MQRLTAFFGFSSQRRPATELPPPRPAFQNSVSTSEDSQPRESIYQRVRFSTTVTEFVIEPGTIEAHVERTLDALDAWKKEIVSLLLNSLANRSPDPHFKKFVLWYFEKHVNLDAEEIVVLFEMIRSKRLNSFIDEKTPHCIEDTCIKMTLQLLIDNSASLREVDLSHMDLSNFDFSNQVDLTNANLSHALLKNADLRGANLKYAILDGTDLTGACLDDANLSSVKLADAYPEGPIFDFASLKKANLTYANLTGASLKETTLSYARCVLTRFSHASLEKVDFNSTQLQGSVFTNATLKSISFLHTDISRAHLDEATLVNTLLF